jgi:hypothetical protein
MCFSGVFSCLKMCCTTNVNWFASGSRLVVFSICAAHLNKYKPTLFSKTKTIHTRKTTAQRLRTTINNINPRILLHGGCDAEKISFLANAGVVGAGAARFWREIES